MVWTGAGLALRSWPVFATNLWPLLLTEFRRAVPDLELDSLRPPRAGFGSDQVFVSTPGFIFEYLRQFPEFTVLLLIGAGYLPPRSSGASRAVRALGLFGLAASCT